MTEISLKGLNSSETLEKTKITGAALLYRVLGTLLGDKHRHEPRRLWHRAHGQGSGKKKAHKHKFFVRLVPVFTGFVPGTNPVCPWDKPGEKQGQTQEFSLFYTVEARFHRVCPWDKPGLSQAQKVYVKKVYVPFSLAKGGARQHSLSEKGSGKGSGEGVLRRVLRTGSCYGFYSKKGF